MFITARYFYFLAFLNAVYLVLGDVDMKPSWIFTRYLCSLSLRTGFCIPVYASHLEVHYVHILRINSWNLLSKFVILLGGSFSIIGQTQGRWLFFGDVSILKFWNKIIIFHTMELFYQIAGVRIHMLLCLTFHPYSYSRSRLYTYDDVVERVAQQLGLDDPSKIRLTPHNCYSQQPKPQPIKHRGVDHLSDMLVHYNQVLIFCFLKEVLIVKYLIFVLEKYHILFFSSTSDIRYIILWSARHPSTRITRLENSESCISSCHQGRGEYGNLRRGVLDWDFKRLF